MADPRYSALAQALTGSALQAVTPADADYKAQMRANEDRNFRYALPGPYNTPLPPKEEQAFRQWVRANNVNFNPDASKADYDMRGFYKAMMAGDPNAQSAVNPYDHLIHYPDTYKTPAEPTFSRESKYATPNAPHWVNDRFLVDESGNVLFDAANPGEH